MLLGMLVVSCAGCAGTVQFGLQDKPKVPTPYVDALKQLPVGTVLDSMNLRDSLQTLLIMFQYSDTAMYCALSAVDPVANPGLLETMLRDFKARKDLETGRGDTPDRCEWWNDFWEKRAKYCFSHFRTSFFGRFLEPMRTEAVFKNGIPDEDYWIEVPCFTMQDKPGTGQCQVNELEWKGGKQLAYQADADGEIAMMVPSQNALGRKRKPAERLFAMKEDERRFVSLQTPQFDPFPVGTKDFSASVYLSTFPNGDVYDVYLVSGVPMKQLMNGDSTLEFTATTNIYSQANVVVKNDSVPIRNIPASTPGLADGVIPVVQHFQLPAGTYSVWQTFRGKTEALQKPYPMTLQLPSVYTSQPVVSEVLFLETPQPSEKFGNRVVRNTTAYKPRVSRVFAPGESLYVYLEHDVSKFPKDYLGNYAYGVDISIMGPVKESGKVGEAFAMPTTNDHTGPASSHKLRKGFFGEPLSTPKFPNAHSAKGWFLNTDPIKLPKKLKEGTYFFVVVYYSLINNEEFRSWREIDIKNP
jgi:hypothetical protein